MELEKTGLYKENQIYKQKKFFNCKFNEFIIIIILLIDINISFFMYEKMTIKNEVMLTQLKNGYDNLFFKNGELFKEIIKLIDTDIKSKDYQLYEQLDIFKLYIINMKNESSIYQLIRPMNVFEKKKIRIGSNSDGGYILLDDFENIKYVYSFGISSEVSFDKAMADRNLEIFMYDHTIDKLPMNNSRFHWKRIGLTGNKRIGKNLKTLNELISENGHNNEKNIILKMDIESSEWEVFQEINENDLKKFKYIVGEFHFSSSRNFNYEHILKKLNKTHQIFHLHCNNCCGFSIVNEIKICNCLEISFVLRENNKFIKSNEIYPIKDLDKKNCLKKNDINLFLNLLK